MVLILYPRIYACMWWVNSIQSKIEIALFEWNGLDFVLLDLCVYVVGQ